MRTRVPSRSGKVSASERTKSRRATASTVKQDGPVEPFGLHALVDGRTCQALDVALERRVVVEGLAAAAMLDDAERDAAHLRDLERPLQGYLVLEVGVQVDEWKAEPGCGGDLIEYLERLGSFQTPRWFRSYVGLRVARSETGHSVLECYANSTTEFR